MNYVYVVHTIYKRQINGRDNSATAVCLHEKDALAIRERNEDRQDILDTVIQHILVQE